MGPDRGQRQLGRRAGIYSFISSKAAPHTSRQGSFRWSSPIGLTTEAKLGNLSDKNCRPHLGRGSVRFAVSVDRGASVETLPISDAICVRNDRCHAGVRVDAACSSGWDNSGPRAGLMLGSRREGQIGINLALGVTNLSLQQP